MTPEQLQQDQQMIDAGWESVEPNKYGMWTLNEENRKKYHESLFKDAQKSDQEIYDEYKQFFGDNISEDAFDLWTSQISLSLTYSANCQSNKLSY